MLREQEQSVATIRKEVATASNRLDVIVSWSQSTANVQKLWVLGDIPGQTFTYAEALIEAQRVAAAVGAIPPSRMGLASNSATSALLTAVKGLRQTVAQLDTGLGAVSKTDGGFDVSPAYIATRKDGEQLADIGQLAAACVSSAEAVKAALPQFIVYPKHEAKIGKTEVAENASLRQAINAGTQRLAEALTEVEAKLSEVRSAQTLAAESAMQAGTLKDEVSSSTAEAVRVAEEARSAIEKIHSESEEVKKAIDKSVAEVNNLKDEAVGIKSDADAFQTELSDARSKLEELISRADTKFAEQSAYVTKVEELVTKATDMLSQATVAGLAKAFDDERKDLDRRMKGAMLGFGVGIGFIFVVTAMLAAYVFRIEVGKSFLGIPSNEATVTLSGFLARSVILLGPVWLALFSARRYRNLFDLRQQYSHKYNMAFSVNGFQTQAPEYREQIAYWVFQTIGANPVSSSSDKGGMDEHPMDGIKDLLQSVVDKVPFPQKADA